MATIKAWALIILGALVLAGTLQACSDTAEAHSLQAWKCKSLAYQRAPNGERARYGHGSTAAAQARAALRYYRVAGWRPWECA